MMDFTQMSDAAIAQFICENFREFEEPDDSNACRVAEAVTHRGAVVEKKPFGFAVVYPAGTLYGPDSAKQGQPRSEATLGYFYVQKQLRRTHNGKAFVQELLLNYGQQGMALLCHGYGRAEFFRKCGFTGNPPTADDWWKMQTPVKRWSIRTGATYI